MCFGWCDDLRIAERSGDDLALDLARLTLGVALVHRQTAAERDRGQKLLSEVSEVLPPSPTYGMSSATRSTNRSPAAAKR